MTQSIHVICLTLKDGGRRSVVFQGTHSNDTPFTMTPAYLHQLLRTGELPYLEVALYSQPNPELDQCATTILAALANHLAQNASTPTSAKTDAMNMMEYCVNEAYATPEQSNQKAARLCNFLTTELKSQIRARELVATLLELARALTPSTVLPEETVSF